MEEAGMRLNYKHRKLQGEGHSTGPGGFQGACRLGCVCRAPLVQ